MDAGDLRIAYISEGIYRAARVSLSPQVSGGSRGFSHLSCCLSTVCGGVAFPRALARVFPAGNSLFPAGQNRPGWLAWGTRRGHYFSARSGSRGAAKPPTHPPHEGELDTAGGRLCTPVDGCSKPDWLVAAPPENESGVASDPSLTCRGRPSGKHSRG